MVLVTLKNLIFPSSGLHRYSPINIDLEHSPTFSSTTLADPEDGHDFDKRSFQDDGPPDTTSHSSNSRIDPRIISDATIGLSDGLTVPFALTAGLSALGSSRVVIFGGLAELMAGSVSMGLGGWLAARGECEAQESIIRSTRSLVYNSPAAALQLARSTIQPYLSTTSGSQAADISLSKDPQILTSFLLAFHHNIPSTSSARSAWISALTISAGYFFGGLIPLLPYFFLPDVGHAFYWSAWVMAIALFLFGWTKTYVTVAGDSQSPHQGIHWRARLYWRYVWGGMQMVVLGGIAASASMGLVKAFDDAGGAS